MNHKIMMIVLLIPIVSCAVGDAPGRDARIKELLNLKMKIENKAVKLSSRICKENKKLTAYTENMYKLYKIPTDESDKKASIPESFEAVVFHLSYLFDGGGDVEPFIEKAFQKEKGTDVKLMCLRLIIQQLVVDRMTNQYRVLTEKLTTVNKELRALREICSNLS